MDRNEKLKILQTLDEKTLTERFLIPLHIEGMKCRKVQYNHGPLEYGKDFIYCTTNIYGNVIYAGVQVKAVRITARNKDKILSKITTALGGSFTDLNDGKRKRLDKIVLITSHDITEVAKESLWMSLRSSNLDRVVEFIDGSELVSLLDTHLPSAFWEEHDYFNKYYNALKKEFETIKDISAVGQKEPIKLEKIYVSLKLTERRKPRVGSLERRKRLLSPSLSSYVISLTVINPSGGT